MKALKGRCIKRNQESISLQTAGKERVGSSHCPPVVDKLVWETKHQCRKAYEGGASRHRSRAGVSHTGRGLTPRHHSFCTAGPIPTSWVTIKWGKRSPEAPLFTIFHLTERWRVPCLSTDIATCLPRMEGDRVPLDTATNGLMAAHRLGGGWRTTYILPMQRAVFAGQSVATAVTTWKHTQHPTVSKHNFQKLKDNPCTHKLMREAPRWETCSEGAKEL